MKLSQGEYVALEKVESTHSTLSEIAQIYVHGDGLQSYLVAVVVPDPVQLSAVAAKVLGKKLSPTDLVTLSAACQEPAIVNYFLEILMKSSQEKGLKGYVAHTYFSFRADGLPTRFETIKRVHLSMKPFSIDTNTLTPTMKIRRKEAYDFHKAAIDALYSLGEPSKLWTSHEGYLLDYSDGFL